MNVVLRLCDMLEGHVTTDNFFTSFSLAQQLLKQKMALVGTLRKNKGEIPPSFLEHHQPLLSSKFAFTRDITLVSYQGIAPKTAVVKKWEYRKKIFMTF